MAMNFFSVGSGREITFDHTTLGREKRERDFRWKKESLSFVWQTVCKWFFLLRELLEWGDL